MQDREYTMLCAMCLMALVTGVLGGIARWVVPEGKLHFIGKGLIILWRLGWALASSQPRRGFRSPDGPCVALPSLRCSG